ncbi:MAG: pyridoxamine 5'-phosphate oxidase family protein [Actinomycetota bacterium]
MDLTETEQTFLERHHSAAMITRRADGTPHAVRVALGLVAGKLWSSGTRTAPGSSHLRRDPRSKLFVFETAWRWLALDTTVSILDGVEAPELNLRLFLTLQEQMRFGPRAGGVMWAGEEITPDEFLRIMVEEERLIYEFRVTRAHGLNGSRPDAEARNLDPWGSPSYQGA